MSEGERKLMDDRGQYLQAVTEGRDIQDADWTQCRIVLTTERIALITDEKRVLPLGDIDDIGGRYDVNQNAAGVASYVTLHLEDDIILLRAPEQDAFETDLYRAFLDNTIIYVQHPAVKGGVVQGAEWQRAKIKLTDEAVQIAVADGQYVTIERDDIGDVETDERTVDGGERRIFEVEHTDSEDRSVETHIAGEGQQVTILKAIFEEGVERNRANLDLSPTEQQIVMALHSGVSPFDLPDFVDEDVTDIEAIFDRLIELDVIETIRERTEVEMTSRGRQVASEEMGSQ
ncbi:MULTISPECIES: CheF family chemotaxis protein [unclassified Halorhabdus]|uniref:CheF family chemotaxis protein n=1 Tax=unclassified Halorhabdus TaxID=2621901 RepID=UPI0023DCD010|nr:MULTISPECIES: CheF family chemotaxis protein [unclassified Halorhabdus]WEL16806.1 Component of chemotaxis system associated with archaellum, contains CheF-like and HTH domain [Halorhabdus sp. SVX81]WEL20680.1 Component of chemotaxis system associated with archaellum, contains CheF-like and HTH domain [Halorhabdus sp. BNX81]